MSHRCNAAHVSREGNRQHSVATALVVGLLLGGVAAAQDSPSSRPGLTLNTGAAPAGVRRITLRQAQQLAAAATGPLERLGQLQVEAAEQHRLGVKALYFPNVSSQLENLHFNKRPGEVLTVRRPLAGTVVGVPVNVIEQDQTAVNFSVVQPITPIFAVRQLVTIATADENIARAKAGLPAIERASLVEQNFFELLVAERELISAGAEVRKVKVTSESNGTARSWVLAASTVKRLTASLNEMLGLPADTRLELVPPEPFVEHLTLEDATAQAAATSTAVVEAEQTAVKARAGSRLAKMEYFPTVAVFGGYTHQSAINVVLPENFSYIGFMATYTLFDAGKRERGVKEGRLQAQAAELGVELTRAKVAQAVKTTYFELERSRELVQLARRIAPAAPRVLQASYSSDNSEADSAQAHMDAELLRAELEYRQAYARMKSLMGNQ